MRVKQLHFWAGSRFLGGWATCRLGGGGGGGGGGGAPPPPPPPPPPPRRHVAHPPRNLLPAQKCSCFTLILLLSMKKFHLMTTFPSYLLNKRFYLNVLTLPVTTAWNEQFFSALKRVKSYIRTTTGSERLSSLLLMIVDNEFVKKILTLKNL